MLEYEIIDNIKSDRLLLVGDKSNKQYLYYDKYKLLIPLNQKYINKKINNNLLIKHQNVLLNNIACKLSLIKKQHAVEVFRKIRETNRVKAWEIGSNSWILNDEQDLNSIYLKYNGYNEMLEIIEEKESKILMVIYLQGEHIVDAQYKYVNLNIFSKFGLRIQNINIYQEEQGNFKQVMNELNEEHTSNKLKSKEEDMNSNIEKLLNCDKERCGLKSYEIEMLYDIKAGHWDVFENSDLYAEDEKLIPRNPKLDIKKNGIIGIDFGTKSTVVVKQEGSNEIRPIRIGSLSLRAEVSESDYENPTIISCMNIDKFLKNYDAKIGRPETSCDDLFVSYNAYNDYKNCPTENFYGYYSDLKQWSNHEKEEVVIQDIQNKKKYSLSEESSLENNSLNPIEVYAYYIGMYINNMKNGIYLKYIMSFPVKYSKETKELIRKSFEKGLKKSLPTCVVEDSEIMSNFSIQYQISEPAAYAVTALEQSGFKPKDENEKYLYGIFDFGGGTTDFDFGVWRGASDEEYDKFNCDYILECFGADSDVRLGGENILEMLAYEVFRENKVMAAEKKVTCALPMDEIAFIGGEYLISNSQSANRNLTLLKEALRPLWEQHENWQEKYIKKKNVRVKEVVNSEIKEECIEIQLYDINGKSVPNCKFIIDTQKLIDLIKIRIKRGVDAFFNCIEKSIFMNKIAQYASEKIYIFLAGNSCKSDFVKEIFINEISEYNKKYEKIEKKEQDRFELIETLKGSNMESEYIPNAKTSVACGLVRSRPGGKIYVKKNYETDSSKETRFKYYLGSDRRGSFDCKLSPIVMGAEGENIISYNIWHKFQGAGMGIARIYYTEDSRADSKGLKLDISNIPFCEISFEAEEDKYLFVRAIKPTVIEYVIANSIDEIDGTITELDIDGK